MGLVVLIISLVVFTWGAIFFAAGPLAQSPKVNFGAGTAVMSLGVAGILWSGTL